MCCSPRFSGPFRLPSAVQPPGSPRNRTPRSAATSPYRRRSSGAKSFCAPNRFRQPWPIRRNLLHAGHRFPVRDRRASVHVREPLRCAGGEFGRLLGGRLLQSFSARGRDNSMVQPGQSGRCLPLPPLKFRALPDRPRNRLLAGHPDAGGASRRPAPLEEQPLHGAGDRTRMAWARPGRAGPLLHGHQPAV